MYCPKCGDKKDTYVCESCGYTNKEFSIKTIQDYEIIEHGLMFPCYFQGCGTSCTTFTDVATGTGDSSHEALYDALIFLAQNDWDVEPIPNTLSYEDQINDWIRQNHPDIDDCESIEIDTPRVYVSIRVK